MGMGAGTSTAIGAGGFLIGPRVAGEQAERGGRGEEGRRFSFLSHFLSSGNKVALNLFKLLLLLLQLNVLCYANL